MAVAKRFASSLQDLDDGILHLIDVSQARRPGFSRPVHLHHDHLFRIPEHRDIRVVGDEDQLPFVAQVADAVNQFLGNEGVVEIVLRLIDQQRVVRLAKD